MREVEAAVPASYACQISLIDHINQRLDRGKRTLRRDMLIGLIRDWRTAPALQRFRVQFVQTKNEVFEDQLTSARMRPAFDDTWIGLEPRLAVRRFTLQVGKRLDEKSLNVRIVASISLHAMARWFSRNQDNGEAALLRDIGQLSVSQKIDESFAIATPHGRWVGELAAIRGKDITFRDDDDSIMPIFSVRTFLADDMDED